MHPQITSKLPATGTTIFTVMSSLAVQHKAINLGQGFPDFMMNDKLMALVNAAMQNGHNQYVHMNGLPALRQTLSEKINFLYKAKVNYDTEITVTPGGTYALYTALTSILQPGDEVIIFEPAYDSYLPAIHLNKAVVVAVPLSFPGYNIDWDLVKEKISAKTKAIIINTPHNPTGAVLSKDDIEQLRSIVTGTGIFIISDEVYEHLIFDDKQHHSMLMYPDLLARSFVCFSFGKVYHCTGWKLGYCIAPEKFMAEFRKVHQFNCFTCNSPMQFAINEFLQEKEQYLGLGKFAEGKRNYFQQLMSETKFEALPTFGSYFQLYSYANISVESEYDFAVKLTKEVGVATIPVSSFYSSSIDNKVLRFCFVKKEETLEAAVSRLLKL
ncbi:MAG: methionine aminotransferase [Ferruginibacter sp.]